MNLLDICIPQTHHALLKMMPHAFCQGRVAHKTLESEIDLAMILHSGRQSEKSKAFDAYVRTDFVALPPEHIYEEYEHCHRNWTTARLAFLTRNTVETTNMDCKHPHVTVL